VEGESRRDSSMGTGRTRQGKLIHFPARQGQLPRAGAFAQVAVAGAAPHHLIGDLVQVTAAPRHRTRIPVAAG